MGQVADTEIKHGHAWGFLLLPDSHPAYGRPL